MGKRHHHSPTQRHGKDRKSKTTNASDLGSSVHISGPERASERESKGPSPDAGPQPGMATPTHQSVTPEPLVDRESTTPSSVALSDWQLCGVSVTGLAHLRTGLPCQDAVTWCNKVRPILALSDGAGSAAISERGAAELVRGMKRFLMSMEDAIAGWLDHASEKTSEQSELWSRRLLAHAQGLLTDLAHMERRSVRDVRATLLLAVLGTTHIFWWQVGDGAIVSRSADGLQALGSTSKAKGEFANQTCFVDNASLDDLQFGLLPTADILGLALMSDGGAERLVAHDGSRVASRLGSWLDDVAQRSLSPDRLALAFHEPAMWEYTTLDDRSIVLAARSSMHKMGDGQQRLG